MNRLLIGAQEHIDFMLTGVVFDILGGRVTC